MSNLPPLPDIGDSHGGSTSDVTMADAPAEAAEDIQDENALNKAEQEK